MARTKGSVNKSKKVKVGDKVKFFNVETMKQDSGIIASIPEETDEVVGKPIEAVVPQNVPLGTSCQCGHRKESHYGGEKGWCNTGGCGCLEHRC